MLLPFQVEDELARGQHRVLQERRKAGFDQELAAVQKDHAVEQRNLLDRCDFLTVVTGATNFYLIRHVCQVVMEEYQDHLCEKTKTQSWMKEIKFYPIRICY